MDLFRARRVPFMARRNYLVELRHLLFWGVFAGLVEGSVSAVIVSKTFDAGNLLITLVQATPAFANVMSLLWGAMLVGRRRLPILLALGAAAACATLSVGLTPHTPWGGWIFALQVGLSRVFLAGVVETRASLWKSNYPRSHRGRITAALQIVRTTGGLALILGCGLLFDRNPNAYRWFYPAVAGVGALALLLFSRVRVRGERARLARPNLVYVNADNSNGLTGPLSMRELLTPHRLLGRMRDALRADPRFARYCVAQMCIGSANLMVGPVNTIVLTKVLKLSYTFSNVLMDVLPRLITLLMLPFWARLFDRVGVLRFRVVNSTCWSLSLALCGAGAMLALAGVHPAAGLPLAALLVYIVGRIADGMAQAGGAIAWNIGHLHFAEDDKAELYMGVHVSLTGARGLVAPFIGALLYQWITWGAFVAALAVALTGLVLFARLAREEPQAPHPLQPELVEDGVGPGDGVG